MGTRRMGSAQQRMVAALQAAGQGGLTRRDLALLLYGDDTPRTREQVSKVRERLGLRRFPVNVEVAHVYRLRPTDDGRLVQPDASAAGRE